MSAIYIRLHKWWWHQIGTRLKLLTGYQSTRYTVKSSCHMVNSSPVRSSHTCLITQSTRHQWIHNKAISCHRRSAQTVLKRTM